MFKGVIILLLLLSLDSFAGECRIALDIGHDPIHQGATSSRGKGEYKFNRRIALMTYHKLLDYGIDAFFINSQEHTISLKKRCTSAKENDGNIFISFHHDSVKERFLKVWYPHGKRSYYCDLFKGYSIFVSKKNHYFKDSLSLASTIGAHLRAFGLTRSNYHSMDIKGEQKHLLDTTNNVYQYDNLVVLKESPMPAILIECGVIVNRDEELMLWSEKHLSKMAEAITSALKHYCINKE